MDSVTTGEGLASASTLERLGPEKLFFCRITAVHDFYPSHLSPRPFLCLDENNLNSI